MDLSNKKEFIAACKEISKRDNSFRHAWVIGESSGGNCWGGDARYYPVNSSEGSAFPTLEKFLFTHFIDAPFLWYKNLEEKITLGNDINTEYYGNYTEYGTKEISFENLYLAIAEWKEWSLE